MANIAPANGYAKLYVIVPCIFDMAGLYLSYVACLHHSGMASAPLCMVETLSVLTCIPAQDQQAFQTTNAHQ